MRSLAIEDQKKLIEWLKVGRDACLVIYGRERPDTPRRLKAVAALRALETLVREFPGGVKQYESRANALTYREPTVREFADIYNINIQCQNLACGHITVDIAPNRLPLDMKVVDVNRRLKCSKCGHVGGRLFFNTRSRSKGRH